MKTLRSILISFVLLLGIAPAAHAGLQSELNQMFGEMSATTNPQVVVNGQRGVITGGAFSMRSPIVPINGNAINFTPPGITAGCSGIDAYGGSFSFIAGGQFVQLLRSIAANAEGFAFQLALQSMSSEISNLLSSDESDLIKRVGQLKNSCEAAQAGLNYLGINQSSVNQAAQNIETGMGLTTDSNSAATSNTPNTPASTTVATTAPQQAKLIFHNVMWNVLENSNTAGAFEQTVDAHTFDEEIMSLTGYVIVCATGKSPNCQQSSGAPPGAGITIGRPTLNLEDIVYGASNTQSQSGSAMIYQCIDPAGCMNVAQAPWSGTGVLSLVQQQLGTNADTGFLGVLLDNGTVTPQLAEFMNAAGPIGAVIAKVARSQPAEAVSFAQAVSSSLAIEIAYNDTRTILDAAQQALRGSSAIGAKTQMQLIDTALDNLSKSYSHMMAEQGGGDQANELADAFLSMNASSSGHSGGTQ